MSAPLSSPLSPPAPASSSSYSPSPSPAPSRSPLATPAFRQLLLAQACFGVAYSIFLILPKYFATALAAGPGRIGAIMAGGSLANVIAAPLIGRLTSGREVRRAMVIGHLAMAAGALAFLFVSTAGSAAFAARALQGIGWALVFTSAGLIAVSLAAPDRLAEAIALQGSANLITNAIGPALAEPLLDRYGPTPVFLAGAAMALLGAVFTTRVPLPAAAAKQAADSAPTRPPAGARVFVLVTSLVLGLACGLMFTMHQPLALARGHTQVADFLVAYTIAAIGIRLFLGRLTRRFRVATVTSASFVFYGAVVAAMAGLGPSGLWVYGAVFGLAHGVFFPSFLALVIGNAPDSTRPGVLAAFNAAFNGGMIAVIPLGMLAESYGFAAAFVPVGVLTIATAMLLPRGSRLLAKRAADG
jgi:MFS family permease